MAKKKKRTKKMWELTPEEWLERLAKSMNKTGFEQEDFFNDIQDEIIRITDKIDDLDEKLDEIAEIEEERELTPEEEAQYDKLLTRSDIEHGHFMSLYASTSTLVTVFLVYALGMPEKIAVMETANIMNDLLDDDLFSLIMKHTNIFLSYYVLMTRSEDIDFEEMEERNEEVLDKIDDDVTELLDNFINDDDDDEDLDFDELPEDDEDPATPILS